MRTLERRPYGEKLPGRHVEFVLPLNAVGADTLVDACAQLSATEAQAVDRRTGVAGHFHLETEGGRFDFSPVANHNLALLTGSRCGDGVFHRFTEWFADSGIDLVSAREFDGVYEYWQNATDFVEYRVAGRSTENLATRSNGLPAPLTQVIVDTSHNPGRRILRSGYVEAIGHHMLLGPEFFVRVPRARKDLLLAVDFLKCEEATAGLDVQVPAGPFVDESTTDPQRRLREVLFPSAGDEPILDKRD